MTAGTRTATVADAVRAHVSWLGALADLPGGASWQDGPLHWAWVAHERTLHGLFPVDAPADVVARGLDAARERDATSVAIWSDVDVDRPHLLDLGFELGWQPWWMGASTAAIDPTAALLGRRVSLAARVPDHDAAGGPLLARGDTWRAEARSSDRYAGRAWLHVDGDLAGLFDMAVWSRFRRQGLGRDLVGLIAATARDHGADRIVLNATAEGEKLYSTAGFVRLGEGRTWWYHLDPERRHPHSAEGHSPDGHSPGSG